MKSTLCFLKKTPHLLLFLIGVLTLSACLEQRGFSTSPSIESEGQTPESSPPPPPVSPEKTQTFTAHSNSIMNPERGFHRWIDWSHTQSHYTSIRTGGFTLGILVVRLDQFRQSALPTAFLDDLTTRFGYARTAGIKLTLKFSYNEGPYPQSEPDASESWILSHITQLQPILQANQDVIAFVQAGFIGAWGEWHTSTNDLLNLNTQPSPAQNILTAVTQALPSGLFVQIRYPRYKAHFFGSTPISSQEAFGTTVKARIGHHNDCFLANNTDHGTYTPFNYNTNEIENWKNLIGADGRFSPVGGETCEVSSFNDCPGALTELERQRFTYLNHDYHSDVITKWQNEGCYPEISRRLGYRLSIVDLTYPEFASAGGNLSITFRISNTGMASLINPRPIFVVLEDSSLVRVNLPVNVDPRLWLPGEHEISGTLSVPSGLASGTYRLGLWLPDPSSALQNRPDYAVRLANNDVWDASSGVNFLIDDLEIR